MSSCNNIPNNGFKCIKIKCVHLYTSENSHVYFVIYKNIAFVILLALFSRVYPHFENFATEPKFTTLTVPTGKIDLLACDAEEKREAFQIVCEKVSLSDNQARALYKVVLMENSCSSGRTGLNSIGSSGNWARRPAHMYVSPTFHSYCYNILNILFIRHDGYLLRYRFVHQI